MSANIKDIELFHAKFVKLSALGFCEETIEAINNSDITYGTNDRTLVLAETLLEFMSSEEDTATLHGVVHNFGGDVYVDLEN